MCKKYELTREIKKIKHALTRETINLYRICALRDFDDVKEGDLGGFIEKEANLSHDGNCWVYDNACAYGYARVSDNAKVYEFTQVYERAKVYGNAEVFGNARVFGKARVSGDMKIYAFWQ